MERYTHRRRPSGKKNTGAKSPGMYSDQMVRSLLHRDGHGDLPGAEALEVENAGSLLAALHRDSD